MHAIIKRSQPFLIIALTLLCSGCWDYREIEQSSLPSAMGVELREDNKFNFSTLLVQPLPPGESGSANLQPVLVTGEGPGVALAARRSMLSLSRVPEWAHARALILGEHLIKSDLSLAIDFMTRNRNLRPDITLFVSSSASPEEILSTQTPLVNDVGSGLQELINLNQIQLGVYVPVTTEEFTYRLATPGIEPLVPQLSLRDPPAASQTNGENTDTNSNKANNKKKQIYLNGAAVFKGPKVVGTFNETECRGYRWLSSPVHRGGIIIIPSPFSPEENLLLQIVGFDSKTRPELADGQIEMSIEITAELTLYEQSSASLLIDPQTAVQIESAASREIEAQISSCVNKSQELQSDVMGWGRLVYAYQPDLWETIASDWVNIFPTVKPKIQVKTILKRTGLTSKSFTFR